MDPSWVRQKDAITIKKFYAGCIFRLEASVTRCHFPCNFSRNVEKKSIASCRKHVTRCKLRPQLAMASKNFQTILNKILDRGSGSSADGKLCLNNIESITREVVLVIYHDILS